MAIVKIIIVFKNLERVRQKEKRKETERKIFRKQSVTLPKWPRKRGKHEGRKYTHGILRENL